MPAWESSTSRVVRSPRADAPGTALCPLACVPAAATTTAAEEERMLTAAAAMVKQSKTRPETPAMKSSATQQVIVTSAPSSSEGAGAALGGTPMSGSQPPAKSASPAPSHDGDVTVKAPSSKALEKAKEGRLPAKKSASSGEEGVKAKPDGGPPPPALGKGKLPTKSLPPGKSPVAEGNGEKEPPAGPGGNVPFGLEKSKGGPPAKKGLPAPKKSLEPAKTSTSAPPTTPPTESATVKAPPGMEKAKGVPPPKKPGLVKKKTSEPSSSGDDAPGESKGVPLSKGPPQMKGKSKGPPGKSATSPTPPAAQSEDEGREAKTLPPPKKSVVGLSLSKEPPKSKTLLADGKDKGATEKKAMSPPPGKPSLGKSGLALEGGKEPMKKRPPGLLKKKALDASTPPSKKPSPPVSGDEGGKKLPPKTKPPPGTKSMAWPPSKPLSGA
eukprot:GHVU01083567.1.p1 GENE.GHVU01083567.1~~GHVU01083567.1.p1  ORF type:complete len:440 (+),score=73.26 GHVU01083567.1:283-1602(+)